MRYEKGHKELTRKRILEIAARRFRKEGIDAVGLASLMSDAGLTHGGFYNHFKSKEELVAAALADSFGETLRKQEARALKTKDGKLEKFVRSYLHPKHRDNPDAGCVIAAAATEIARHPESTRKIIDGKIEMLLAFIEENLPAGSPAEERQRAATNVFSLMVGALQLSRITTDPEKSDQILQSGIAAALFLIAQAGAK
jgi:TetR/AcrR family transcriptional repressor of nem operon